MEQPLITVRTAWHDDVLLVSVAGEVDADTAPAVRAALSPLPAALVLDLAGVTFFGSAGIRLLVDARREVGSLAVVASSRPVLRTIGVTGLGGLFALHASPDAALDHVRRTITRRVS